MTREEEYTRAASDYILSTVVPVGSEKLAYGDFINGVKRADKHPKKGLWDSEKVISFLKEHATLENSSNINLHINGATYHYVNDFIDDLCKVMED